MWQVMSDTVRHYCSLLSDIYGHLTSTVWIVLTQNVLVLSTSATVRLTVIIKVIWTQYPELPQKMHTVCSPAETLISWKRMLVAVHWTQSTLPVWRQVTAGFLW